MATITILRPSGTSSAVGWSAVPSGTPDEVTSDDSDSTYALWSGDGAPMILTTPADSPPVGERRHLVRIRARGEDGDAWWAVRLASGSLVAAASGTFPASPSTIVGSWGAGVPPDGSTVLSAYVTGQSAAVKIEELYIDVDTREAPTFTPQVIDGSGTVTTTVSDTAQPMVRANALDTDGLTSRQFHYWVTSGATIVWDSGVISGAPADQQTSALANGSYTAHLIVWTTLGTSTAYPSAENTIAFTVSVGEIPLPDNPTVDPVDGTPFYSIEACAPNVDDLDGGVGYVEVQRVDCSVSTAVSVAILGPLETGDCATWVDYSLPRTLDDSTCEHLDEPCCSYYRARLVGRIDGSLRISDWSDTADPGLPSGLTFMWPSTAASVPVGWNRVTELDGKYPKGIATSTTAPGTTGGATTHTHTTVAHNHTVTHGHTVTGATAAATGSVGSGTGVAGSTSIAASHTHTRSAAASATVSSQTATSPIGSASNDPARFEVIHIESDGTPLGVPDGAVSLTSDISPSGWTAHTGVTAHFPKGAAAAGDGGTLAASALDNHLHTIGAHTHTGTAHTHTSPNASTVASNLTLTAGANSVTWAANHAHAVTVNSGTTAALASGSTGNSGTHTDVPPFRTVGAKKNTSGAPSLPVGLIAVWRKALNLIPNHWRLCDGTGGTLDLIGRYPQGTNSTIGTSGGANTAHTHTDGGHVHTTSGHSHTETVGASTGAAQNALAAATVTVATGTHTHAAGDVDSVTPTVVSSSAALATAAWEPPFQEVAFIQLTSEFIPPTDPAVFCLDWNPDQHLIRSLGPDGPIWAPVLGMFTWDVARPFSSDTGVNGTRFVTSAPPGGRNLHMTAAVESEADLATLQAVLNRPLVLISPSDADEVWAAPVAASVTVVKIGRIRQVTADFIGTGPQPEPQLADVGA
jgi:hypothetical protein